MNRRGIALIATLILAAAPAAMADRKNGNERNTRRNAGNNGQMARLFDSLDRNRDRVVSRQEWPADRRSTFERLDRNRDNRLTPAEFRRRSSDSGDTGFERRDRRDREPAGFSQLDHDRNRVLTRDEWRGDDRSFRKFDKDRNGAISIQEFGRHSGRHNNDDDDEDDDDDDEDDDDDDEDDDRRRSKRRP